MLKVLAGTRPERPVDGVGSVLTDKVWAILQDCWGASPEARPICEVVVYRIGEPGIANVAPMSVKPELSPVYSSVDDHDAANGQGTPGIVHKMAVPDETQKQQAGTISSAGSQDDLLPTPEKQPVKPLELPKGQLASNVDSSSPKITRNSFSTHWLPSLFTRQKASSVMLTPSAPSGRQPARTPPPDALPTTSTGSASPASTLKRSFAASFIPSSLPSLFSVPLALPSTHTSPFAAPAFIPATGAPGFSGDRRWAKDEFKFDLAGELGGGEVGAAGVKRRALALVGKKEGAGVILSGVLADAVRLSLARSRLHTPLLTYRHIPLAPRAPARAPAPCACLDASLFARTAWQLAQHALHLHELTFRPRTTCRARCRWCNVRRGRPRRPADEARFVLWRRRVVRLQSLPQICAGVAD